MGETAATADKRFQKQVDDMATRLADPAVDVTQLDAALKVLQCGAQTTNDAGVTHCSKKLFTIPTDCTTKSDTTVDTSTGPLPFVPGAPGGGKHALLLPHEATEQSAQLASLFQEVDAIRPSRGMSLEWNDLRARWGAGISHAARASVRRRAAWWLVDVAS